MESVDLTVLTLPATIATIDPRRFFRIATARERMLALTMADFTIGKIDLACTFFRNEVCEPKKKTRNARKDGTRGTLPLFANRASIDPRSMTSRMSCTKWKVSRVTSVVRHESTIVCRQEVKERESQTHAIGALRPLSRTALAVRKQDKENGQMQRLTRKRIAGIRQLPLNVFNAAVGARKRSERRGRSVGRSAARFRGLVGVKPCGPPGATPASCSSFDFSLSLYVPGGIAIAGPASML